MNPELQFRERAAVGVVQEPLEEIKVNQTANYAKHANIFNAKAQRCKAAKFFNSKPNFRAESPADDSPG